MALLHSIATIWISRSSVATIWTFILRSHFSSMYRDVQSLNEKYQEQKGIRELKHLRRGLAQIPRPSLLFSSTMGGNHFRSPFRRCGRSIAFYKVAIWPCSTPSSSKPVSHAATTAQPTTAAVRLPEFVLLKKLKWALELRAFRGTRILDVGGMKEQELSVNSKQGVARSCDSPCSLFFALIHFHHPHHGITLGYHLSSPWYASFLISPSTLPFDPFFSLSSSTRLVFSV